MLDDITPVILTYNESPNIGRALAKLDWAHDIVVLDSFSDDDTIAKVREFKQVRVFKKQFESHREQWHYALLETDIRSEWVLALDADYILTAQMINELAHLAPPAGVNGYRARFTYCIHGRPLRGSAYPPTTILYRRQSAVYRQDGHTQRVDIAGKVEDLRSFVLHDDRKPLDRWLRSQARYMRLETEKLLATRREDLSAIDRLRKAIIPAPVVVLVYCLFVKRALLDGYPGIYYAFQRAVAELILSLYLSEQRIVRSGNQDEF